MVARALAYCTYGAVRMIAIALANRVESIQSSPVQSRSVQLQLTVQYYYLYCTVRKNIRDLPPARRALRIIFGGYE